MLARFNNSNFTFPASAPLTLSPVFRGKFEHNSCALDPAKKCSISHHIVMLRFVAFVEVRFSHISWSGGPSNSLQYSSSFLSFLSFRYGHRQHVLPFHLSNDVCAPTVLPFPVESGQSGVMADGELAEGPLSLHSLRPEDHRTTGCMSLAIILVFPRI
jgi:hypothetical protein